MGKEPLLIRIQSYNTYKLRESEYAAQIQEKGYVDAKNNDGHSNIVNKAYSKVEKKGIEFYTIRKKLAYTRREIAQITKYIEESGLTEEEKSVLWLVAKRRRLLPYAKEKGITPSYIYKIRDRAIKKVERCNNLC